MVMHRYIINLLWQPVHNGTHHFLLSSSSPCLLVVHSPPTHLALSGCSLYCEAIQKVPHQRCWGTGHIVSPGSHRVHLGWEWCLCGTNYQLMFHRFPLPVRCNVYYIQDFKKTFRLYLVSVESHSKVKRLAWKCRNNLHVNFVHYTIMVFM